MILRSHPYFNVPIALASKHEKLKLIKPSFDEYVGCKIFEVNEDTDQFGTFSGEVERRNSPYQTAILKARLGMESTNTGIGIASEGSIGTDPFIPFLVSDIEHLVLVDDINHIVISEIYRSFDILYAEITVKPDEDLSEFLRKADFPNHRVIVRPNLKNVISCMKGIGDLDLLRTAIRECANFSLDGSVVIESDLRAMNSPSRQKNIQTLAKKLALRINSLCPECNTPGWGTVGYLKGLRCTDCGEVNTEANRQEALGCVRCDFTGLGNVLAEQLDPSQCQICNP